MKKNFFCIITLAAVLGLTGCTPAAIETVTDEGGADPAGFFTGIWHGFTLLFTFVISLFSDSVGIYEVHNTGNMYNLGYLLGVLAFFGGSSGGACKKGR